MNEKVGPQRKRIDRVRKTELRPENCKDCGYPIDWYDSGDALPKESSNAVAGDVGHDETADRKKKCDTGKICMPE